jgi:ABC-2 type transport system permease protein
MIARAGRLLRAGAVVWWMNVKMMSQSAFDGVLAILWPIFFATVAFFMFQAGGDPESLVYASLGAAVMGVWTATSVPAGSSLQRQRWHGTLELLVAAPTHFSLTLLAVTTATSTIGVYCLVTTLLWGRFAFGIDIPFEDPLALACAIPAAIGSIGLLGFLMSVLFARYRTAWTLGAMLEYPVWLVGGFLVPLTLLPGWVHPVSWVLAPTWGMSAIRDAATGSGSTWPDIAMCVALAGGYTAAGVLLTDRILFAARKRATLSLT